MIKLRDLFEAEWNMPDGEDYVMPPQSQAQDYGLEDYPVGVERPAEFGKYQEVDLSVIDGNNEVPPGKEQNPNATATENPLFIQPDAIFERLMKRLGITT